MHSWMWSPCQCRTSPSMAFVIPQLLHPLCPLLWSSPAVVVVVYRRVSRWGPNLCLSLPWGDVFLWCFPKKKVFLYSCLDLASNTVRYLGKQDTVCGGRNLLFIKQWYWQCRCHSSTRVKGGHGPPFCVQAAKSLSLSAWTAGWALPFTRLQGGVGAQGCFLVSILLCFIISQNFLKWWHLPPGLRGLFDMRTSCFSVLECWWTSVRPTSLIVN